VAIKLQIIQFLMKHTNSTTYYPQGKEQAKSTDMNFIDQIDQ
jgi:hypothetical protein